MSDYIAGHTQFGLKSALDLKLDDLSFNINTTKKEALESIPVDGALNLIESRPKKDYSNYNGNMSNFHIVWLCIKGCHKRNDG